MRTIFDNPYTNIFDSDFRYRRCDITFVFDDDVEIKTHRILLVMYSEYFQSMFKNFKEENEDRIELHDVDSKIFNAILDDIYSANFNKKDFDIYESIEFYRLILYFEIRVNKHNIMGKLFNKFKKKYSIGELNDIFEVAKSFDSEKKKILFETIYIKKSHLYDKEELKFINEYKMDIKNICSMCNSEVNKENRHFGCEHVFHKYCLGDNEKECPLC